MPTNPRPRPYLLPRRAGALLAGALLLLAGRGPDVAHAAETQADAAPAPRAVLTVNGKDVTRADIDQAVEQALGVRLETLPTEQREQIRDMVAPQVESQLVLEIVLLDEATSRGIAVAKEEIDAALEAMKTSLPEEVSMEKALADIGRDVAWLREQIQRGLRIEALLKQAPKATDAADEEARQMAVAAFVKTLVDKAEIVRHEAPVEAPVDGVPVSANAADTAWYTDYETAAQASLRTGHPILANFTGSDWCPYCVKLESEVFATAAFQAWARENVVLLKVDFPRRPLPEAQRKQNDRLRDRYGVRGYPTVLFLDAKGNVQGRSGYAPGGATAWIAGVESALRS